MEESRKSKIMEMLAKDDYNKWLEILQGRPELIRIFEDGNVEFSAEQLKAIRANLVIEHTAKKVMCYANSTFSINRIYKISLMISRKSRNRIIKFLSNPQVSNEIFDYAYDDLYNEYGQILYFREVKIYADPKFNYEQGEKIRDAILYKGLPIRKVKKFAKTKYSSDVMEIIYSDLNNRVPEKIIMGYAKPEFSKEEMLAERKILFEKTLETII